MKNGRAIEPTKEFAGPFSFFKSCLVHEEETRLSPKTEPNAQAQSVPRNTGGPARQ
jgi:hypothetical protein